jgi:hypothetical protein
MAAQSRWDVVLTDCHMPRMDGAEMTRAIRAAADPVLCRVPIIGLTADVTEARREPRVAAGMTELAIKPLTIRQLSEVLARTVPRPDAARPPCAGPPASGVPPALRAIALDDQIFLSIFSPGDPDGVAWLRSYLEAARADVAELSRSCAASSVDDAHLEGIGRVAHRLAGASFSVGAMLVGETSRALDRVANAPGDDLARRRELAAELPARFVAAEAAIDVFLNEAVPP